MKPAAGTIGRNIRNLFNEAIGLKNHLKDGYYELILMNTIQYQCSLGFDTKDCRDKIFIKCWNDFGKSDLENRLKSLFNSGDIVINACTAGKTKPKLREIVENKIIKINGGSTIKVEHSSNWLLRYNTDKNYNWRT